MTRIQELPENVLPERFAEMDRFIAQLKNAPQTIGSSSVLTNRIFSSNPFDIEVTSVGFNNRVVEVTYTPADMVFGGSPVYKMEYKATSSSFMGEPIVERLLPENGIHKWRIYLSGSNVSPVAWVRLKLYFYTTGDGTLAAVIV